MDDTISVLKGISDQESQTEQHLYKLKYQSLTGAMSTS